MVMNTNFSRPTSNHFCWNLSLICEVDHGLLKSLRRHRTVQKDLGLLNSGMLNRRKVLCITVAVDQSTVKIGGNDENLPNGGRNLCVTVAIDHSTVDRFHDELQLSAKNT